VAVVSVAFDDYYSWLTASPRRYIGDGANLPSGGLEILLGQQLVVGKAGLMFDGGYAAYTLGDSPETMGECVYVLEPGNEECLRAVATITLQRDGVDVTYHRAPRDYRKPAEPAAKARAAWQPSLFGAA
jgi:hypothetical protein